MFVDSGFANVNIPNKHLGDWLSAKDQENGVMGASYDIINGVILYII